MSSRAIRRLEQKKKQEQTQEKEEEEEETNRKMGPSFAILIDSSESEEDKSVKVS